MLLGASWGTARAWIASGKVRVAGELALEPTARVRAGQTISFDERARRTASGRLSDDAIMYLDAHIVVVAKPPGVSTVPYTGADGDGPRHTSERDTLDAHVRWWLARHTAAGERRDVRPNLGAVHRLDKETSGLIVFTRTWLAKKSLTAQFRKHIVRRSYLAIAHGEVASRTIRSFLVADRGDGFRGSVRSASPRAWPGGAREAVTHVERLEPLRGATLIACRLETGRTHQIRIHLGEAGHPLLGERVYLRGWTGKPIPAPRLMLHSAELGFVHPATGLAVGWELPMPGDMGEVLKRLRRSP